ncbi:hypothetical protein [Mesoterricola silvestris]|uniref:Uncharacterized protein n=1 Tax=Mesoterricola silvestris TaxID=2927979 RepID=A0AA48K7Y5_9BACT|nr:hypothetical protein [Mesoterricola silvestris]BDU72394.1 hypothetical protein METEAL_15680 [Mesoterricola silvestris]
MTEALQAPVLTPMVWLWEDTGGPRTADVHPDEVQNFIHAGWAIAESKEGEKSLDDMKAGELIAYAESNNLDIGGLVFQAGKEKILAAVKEARTKKAN